MAGMPWRIPDRCGHENRRPETFGGCACTGELCPDCGMVLAFRPISRKHVRLHTNLRSRVDVGGRLSRARPSRWYGPAPGPRKPADTTHPDFLHRRDRDHAREASAYRRCLTAVKPAGIASADD